MSCFALKVVKFILVLLFPINFPFHRDLSSCLKFSSGYSPDIADQVRNPSIDCVVSIHIRWDFWEDRKYFIAPSIHVSLSA
jgi:hypothetical protein